MRVLRLVFAILAMISVAATSSVARESRGSHSGTSKSRTAKHSKSSRLKAATTKKKSSSKKTSTDGRKASRLRDTGDIDVSTGAAQDLPPEELPVSESDDANDSDDEPTLLPPP
jgi:hypothetical protein